jgi:hypothetical protein
MSDPALPAMDTIFKDFLKKKHVGLKKDVVLYVRGGVAEISGGVPGRDEDDQRLF